MDASCIRLLDRRCIESYMIRHTVRAHMPLLPLRPMNHLMLAIIRSGMMHLTMVPYLHPMLQACMVPSIGTVLLRNVPQKPVHELAMQRGQQFRT
jgi:hypothetical protein